MFLRDYEAMQRLYRGNSHSANYHVAILSTAIWFLSAALVVFVVFLVAFKRHIPTAVNPLTADHFIVLLEVTILVIASDRFVTVKVQRFRDSISSRELDYFRCSHERFKRTLATISIFVFVMSAGLLMYLAG